MNGLVFRLTPREVKQDVRNICWLIVEIQTGKDVGAVFARRGRRRQFIRGALGERIDARASDIALTNLVDMSTICIISVTTPGFTCPGQLASATTLVPPS